MRIVTKKKKELERTAKEVEEENFGRKNFLLKIINEKKKEAIVGKGYRNEIKKK